MAIEKRPFWQRFLLPGLLLMGFWLLIDWLVAVQMQPPFSGGNANFYRVWLNILAGTRFGLLLLGTFIIYPIMYFRGASLLERLLGAALLPLTYMISAMSRATDFFPLGQAIYYGFNSLAFGSLFLQLGLVGMTEMACRWWAKRRYRQSGPIVGWPWVAAIFVGGFSLYLTLFWDGGVHWFYVYQEGFKLLFQ